MRQGLAEVLKVLDSFVRLSMRNFLGIEKKEGASEGVRPIALLAVPTRTLSNLLEIDHEGTPLSELSL